MKLFFNWMQNKFNSGPGNRKANANSSTHYSKKEPPKEEFRDWPHELLAIGTFGNNDLKANPESQSDHLPDNSSSSHEDLAEFTPEEVGKLQEELTKFLKRKPASKLESEVADLPLDKFLNCPSSLEVDRRISVNEWCSATKDKDEEDIEITIKIIIGRCKEACNVDNKKKGIGKKSISFLLNKMFVCGGGFAPAPSLRDTLHESRMEKLLWTLLSKKMNPQNSRDSSTKKYIEGNKQKTSEQDEAGEKINDRCKWVQTDSEYIVLEI